MQSWVPFVPDSASTMSWKVDAVYFYLSGVTLFFTLLISAILIFFVIRYRRRTPYEIPRPIAGSHKLETLWTVIPFLIAMTIFGWSAKSILSSLSAAECIEIYVVGKQWMWKIQHSTGQRNQRAACPGWKEDQVDHDHRGHDSRLLRSGVSHES
jgi:cytochrome c oxidase subunit 2